ncbi:MAG TPA: DNA repair protein RecO [Acidimicrobiales bacterium]|nr:DNA repair protein RecO [Acidimicrobiales bacterium]
MSLYRDEGVVLRTMRLGEADRIVTLMTKGHGKVRAVAKGVRRTKSKFGARLEPLSHVTMLCWQGRELDIVNQAEVTDTFRAVREDLGRVSKAFTVLEVVDQISQERHANPRLYDMVVGALRALDAEDAPLLVPAFCLKALALEGSAPLLDECASCGVRHDLVAFDLVEGGVLCRSCRRGRSVSPEALALLRRILGGGLASALAEPEGPLVAEVTDLVTEAMEGHLDRRLRSLRASPTA